MGGEPRGFDDVGPSPAVGSAIEVSGVASAVEAGAVVSARAAPVLDVRGSGGDEGARSVGLTESLQANNAIASNAASIRQRRFIYGSYQSAVSFQWLGSRLMT